MRWINARSNAFHFDLNSFGDGLFDALAKKNLACLYIETTRCPEQRNQLALGVIIACLGESNDFDNRSIAVFSCNLTEHHQPQAMHHAASCEERPAPACSLVAEFPAHVLQAHANSQSTR